MAKHKKPAPTALDGITVVSSSPSPSRRVEMSANDKTQTVYANSAYVEVSNWDVKIRFGLIQSASPDLVSVLDVANVYMSHEHAKVFVEALVKTVGQLDTLKKLLSANAAQPQ
jgi:hypothetical protein